MHAPAVVLVCLVVVALVLFRETVASLVDRWTSSDPTYHHGFLVVAISVYLLYRRWGEARESIRMQPSLSAGLLVLLASLAWLAASLVYVELAQQVVLVLLLGFLLASVVGYRTAWALAFPITLLFFALPIWEPLRPYLQRLTLHGATAVVNVAGVPAVVEGTDIMIPAGVFNVAPTCSGMAYAIVGAMAAALFGYVNRLSFRTSVVLIATAVGVAVLGNILRIATVVVLGQLTAMQHQFVTSDHSVLGWGLFGVLIVTFLLVAGRVVGVNDRENHAQRASVAKSTSIDAFPRLAQCAVLSLAAIVAGPALAHAYRAGPAALGAAAPLTLPARIADWEAVPASPHGYRPAFEAPDAETAKIYRDQSGNEVYLYVGQYARQEQGREAVSLANRVYDAQAWSPVLTRALHLRNDAAVSETRLRSWSGAEKVVWQWYYVDGITVSSGPGAKLLNLWGTLKGDPRIAVVVLAADLVESDESTETTLIRFVDAAKPALASALDGAK